MRPPSGHGNSIPPKTSPVWEIRPLPMFLPPEIPLALRESLLLIPPLDSRLLISLLPIPLL